MWLFFLIFGPLVRWLFREPGWWYYCPWCGLHYDFRVTRQGYYLPGYPEMFPWRGRKRCPRCRWRFTAVAGPGVPEEPWVGLRLTGQALAREPEA